MRFEADGTTTTIVDHLDGVPLNTPNDLAIDRQGRIWLSNPWNAINIDPSEHQVLDHNSILRADPQPDGTWACTRMTHDTTGTNGLLISPDEKTLYMIQTSPERRELRAYDILADGSLGRYTVLRRHRRLLCQRPRPDDLPLGSPGPGSGDPPDAGGCGLPHQLHLWGRRPADPLHHHHRWSPLSGPQYGATRMAHLATGALGTGAHAERGGIRMPSLTESIKVGNQDMALYVAVPSGTGPFPAIVVIQHGNGVDTFVRTMVDRLATAGYAAVAPDLYHRLEPGVERTIRQLTDLEVIADVQATVDFLQHQNAIERVSLGITGFCMGGRVTYLMAAALPQFKAAVAYYGGNIMVPWGEGVVAPFARTSEMRCPLMFHFGEEDTNRSCT